MEFTKGQHIKFKHNNRWLYGIIDNVYDDHCEVSYDTKKWFEKHLRGEHNLDYFCDVNKKELILLSEDHKIVKLIKNAFKKEKTIFTLADMQAAFKAGGNIITWSDFGVQMEYDSFEDWYKSQK